MWNPFRRKVTFTLDHILRVLVSKEAELQLARAHLHNSAQVIEQLQARIAELEKTKDK